MIHGVMLVCTCRQADRFARVYTCTGEVRTGPFRVARVFPMNECNPGCWLPWVLSFGV